MENFREKLFNESRIEQILNFMGNHPKDYYHQLNESEEIVLLVGLPHSGKQNFLYELSKTKVKINFVVHDLLANYSEDVLEKLSHVLSLTKLLNQAKRIKIVILVYCANASLEKQETEQLLKKFNYFLNHVHPIQNKYRDAVQ
jgi:predicted transcriptional regulator